MHRTATIDPVLYDTPIKSTLIVVDLAVPECPPLLAKTGGGALAATAQKHADDGQFTPLGVQSPNQDAPNNEGTLTYNGRGFSPRFEVCHDLATSQSRMATPWTKSSDQLPDPKRPNP